MLAVRQFIYEFKKGKKNPKIYPKLLILVGLKTKLSCLMT
jgi:hypothetical protein